MLIVFVPILAALGAAIVLQGREARGLLVISVGNAANAAVSAATGRWNWFAFSMALVVLAMGGIAMVRNEPAPAPPDEERDPDYCITHKKLEPEEER